MKTVWLLLLFCAICLSASPSAAFQCERCHSKNPKMVRMHDALGNKDCFNCHGPGKKKKGDELLKQKTTDEKCTRCHGVAP